jgi:hypothetical protein
MEWFLFWIGVNALIGYAIGKQKNEVGGAIAISILLGPIGWIIAMVSRGKLRKCPFCAEGVKPEAKVCRHCGRELPANAVKPPAPSAKPYPQPVMTFWMLGGIVVLVFAIFALPLLFRSEKKPQQTAETASAAQTQRAISYPSLTLTKPVELKDSVGRVVVTLPAGQSVQYAYRSNYVARIWFNGRDYQIPISSTDLK